ncbi:MAG: hypothetical protein JJE09_16065 [Bacteroidia bacterium]|nr:hypothetical protein [Bacteroidia bacterium]
MHTNWRALFYFILSFSWAACVSPEQVPHLHAHSHNDYENAQPLFNALQNGFISVEADVHLHEGKLLVAHDSPKANNKYLKELYLSPLDSIVKANSGRIYIGSETTFYLMVDIKTDADATYKLIQEAISSYPTLLCNPKDCPVKIFLSGNRPIDTILKEGYSGIGVDGRPEDIGMGYSIEFMPIISDQYKTWSAWNGQSPPSQKDLQRIKELATRVHAEGKKLRLWAIPDNEVAWAALLDAGVDLINTDRLAELNHFLKQKGL